MGIYYYSLAFKGEMVDVNELPKKYANAKVNNSIIGKTIYYENFVSLANLDPIIDPHEVKQGFVSLKELLSIIEPNPKRKEEWGSITDNDDIFIAEAIWATLEPGDNSLSLSKILPCHD